MKPPLTPNFTSDKRESAHHASVLTPGVIYPGVVSSSLPENGFFNVRLDEKNVQIPCLFAANIFSGLLGFKTTYIPPRKTRVLVFFNGGHHGFAIGAYSNAMVDPGEQQRTATGPGAKSYQKSQKFVSRNSKKQIVRTENKPPVDLVEGEIQIDNLLGVGLSLLRGMSSIQAGDLARIETHLMDDMVRIISGTFKHHSAFGDAHIYSDGGRLNAEWHGTGHEHEAVGVRQPGDEKAKFHKAPKDTEIDFTEVDGVNDEGRWRFSQYLGFLGDFINVFVTDPVNAIGRLAQDQLRAGKARVHVNNDGAILMQSVSDIVLEKVVRIPVPVRIRRPDDPQGNRSEDGLQNGPLKTWDPSGNVFEMAFQLREYARWLNNSYSLGRFRQMNRDFYVPSEAETPLQDVSSAEQDKRSVNGAANNWRIAYATIRIYRDGSIQTMDAYGNSITSTSIGVQISSTSDILLQAAGSVNVVAGKNINLLARNSIDLTAVKEFVRIKGEKGLQFFAAAGNIVMETVNKAIKFIGSLNANDSFSVDTTGNVNASLAVRANQVFASMTMVIDQHPGHLFTGAPIIETVTDEFKYGSDYGADNLYETMSQQFMAKEGVAGSNWSFSENEVSGKGSPWPGSGAKHKKTTAGESLNKPSTAKSFTNTPAQMQNVAVSMKTKS